MMTLYDYVVEFLCEGRGHALYWVSLLVFFFLLLSLTLFSPVVPPLMMTWNLKSKILANIALCIYGRVFLHKEILLKLSFMKRLSKATSCTT